MPPEPKDDPFAGHNDEHCGCGRPGMLLHGQLPRLHPWLPHAPHHQPGCFSVPASASASASVLPASRAGTGERVKDCQATRRDPSRLFFRSTLMRVSPSFSSARQEGVGCGAGGCSSSSPGLGDRCHTQVHPLPAFVVGQQHRLKLQVWDDHGLDPIRHRVKLRGGHKRGTVAGLVLHVSHAGQLWFLYLQGGRC